MSVDTIETILNQNEPKYFKIKHSHVKAVKTEEDGFVRKITGNVKLDTTELADKVVAQDYQWLKDNSYEKYFLTRDENDELVFDESKVEEVGNMIEEAKTTISGKFVNNNKCNVYGRVNVTQHAEVVFSDKGRGEWR